VNGEKILAALQTARAYIKDDLKVRERSYLPNPTEDEAEEIEEAKQALAAVNGAIAEMLGEPSA
jgi:hypothetical protein